MALKYDNDKHFDDDIVIKWNKLKFAFDLCVKNGARLDISNGKCMVGLWQMDDEPGGMGLDEITKARHKQKYIQFIRTTGRPHLHFDVRLPLLPPPPHNNFHLHLSLYRTIVIQCPTRPVVVRFTKVQRIYLSN